MLLSRVGTFFRSEHESESELASIVDTIISIKTFDIKNEIRRGLFVLKNRGRPLRSQLQTMDIDTRSGITVSFRGWEFEGMLSGETGTIREPEVFVKLFYENPAEQELNKKLISEFKRRYAEKGRFTEVWKPAIYSEFWSFRGHYGAGHANTRAVSISMYMVEAFRALDRLHDLSQFFPEQLHRRIDQDFRWKRYRATPRMYDSIPTYIDLGLLVTRLDHAAVLRKELKGQAYKELASGLFTDSGTDDPIDAAKQISWESIAKLSRSDDVRNVLGEGRYVFSLPYLYNAAEFVAFFFEVLWTKGGDIYHFPPVSSANEEEERMSFYKKRILGNAAIWEDFARVVEERAKVAEDTEQLNEVSKLAERLEGVGEILSRKYEPLPPRRDPDSHAWARSYISGVIGAVRTYIIPKLKLEMNEPDTITIGPANPYVKSALEFIYDLVFDSGGMVPNPHDGDFARESILCRKWYSQIEDLLPVRKGRDDERRPRDPRIRVRALPYFEMKGRKKSCTTENVWCLALIKEALSPEIGWILIDTLTSPDWVDRRASWRRGFPHRFEEIKAMAHHDPAVYGLLEEIIANKQLKESVYDAKMKLVGADLTEEGFKQQVRNFLAGHYHDRDVSEVLKALKERDAKRLDLFKQLIPEPLRSLNDEHPALESDFEKDLTLRSKLPANRPFFHRVEMILHEELVRLFSPAGRRYWYRKLTGQTDLGMTDIRIGDELRKLRAAEKNEETTSGQVVRRPGLIDSALREMHDSLVLDLLTSMTKDVQRFLPASTGSASADRHFTS
jgi:hypothetical protein